MNCGEPVAVVEKSVIAEEDLLRAEFYSLLAKLLSAAPDSQQLASIGQLRGDDTTLGHAIEGLSRVAAGLGEGVVAEEYQSLFIGMGRGELLPYGSYYLTGFLHEKPLAKLRSDMAELGAVRADSVSEPEDHVACILEVMAGLITGRFGAPASVAKQKDFFDAHIASWMDVFFRDLAGASSSVLYAALAEVGSRFLDIETAAFAMD
ncbi:MAG: TorD/DmsD family molecular chaperone [Hyphomicrobiaceae bacterium]